MSSNRQGQGNPVFPSRPTVGNETSLRRPPAGAISIVTPADGLENLPPSNTRRTVAGDDRKPVRVCHVGPLHRLPQAFARAGIVDDNAGAGGIRPDRECAGSGGVVVHCAVPLLRAARAIQIERWVTRLRGNPPSLYGGMGMETVANSMS